jgi:hypothetical protein
MNELAHCLEPGKRVEVDNGYIGHTNKVKCPNNNCNPMENLAIQAPVRSQHETLNGRLKNWGILGQVYRHNIAVHGTVLRMRCDHPACHLQRITTLQGGIRGLVGGGKQARHQG